MSFSVSIRSTGRSTSSSCPAKETRHSSCNEEEEGEDEEEGKEEARGEVGE